MPGWSTTVTTGAGGRPVRRPGCLTSAGREHRRSSRYLFNVTVTEDIDVFCRTVEARSLEHREAMDVAMERGWWAIAGSVLRMELDSMIRVIYLLRTPEARDRILASSVAGKGFKDGERRVLDRTMVEVAVADNGWVRSVYDFGNKFVHLTDAHDYAETDALEAYEQRDEIIRYLNHYHGDTVLGRRLDDGATLREVAAYAPRVLEKITSNQRSYIATLREVG